MCSDTVAVFLLPLDIGIIQFFDGYDYSWTITLLSESSWVSTSRIDSLGTRLVSQKLTSRNMSIIHSLYFFYNCIHPSPSYVTYLKLLFKYVKIMSFQGHLLGSSNSFSMTHLKTYLNTHACME